MKRTVPCVFNITGIFEQIVNCFNDRSFPEEDFIPKRRQTVFHIASEASNDVNAVVKERLKKRLRNVSFVAEKFAEKILCQLFHDLQVSVVRVSGRQAKRKDLAFVIDHKMQFETVEPAHCAFPTHRPILKNLVTRNAFIMANDNFGTVYKRDSGAFSKTNHIQEAHHWKKYAALNLHKTIV
jgi:hypothetical protein